MNVLYVARDVGPSQMLELIAEATKTCCDVASALYGEFEDNEVLEDVQMGLYDAVGLGVGSRHNDLEEKIILACHETDTPVVVIEDIPCAANRLNDEVRERALVATYEQMLETVGAPPPHIVRSVRALEELCEVVVSNREVIFFPAGKDARLNNRVLELLLDTTRDDTVVWFRPHPREVLDDDSGMKRSLILDEHGDRIVGKDDQPDMQEAMLTAGVTIFLGPSTDSIAGAYARVPMILYKTPAGVEETKRLGFEDGVWYVEEKKGVITTGVLDATIEKFFDGDAVARHLRSSQEYSFPSFKSTPQEVAKAYDEALADLLPS